MNVSFKNYKDQANCCINPRKRVLDQNETDQKTQKLKIELQQQTDSANLFKTQVESLTHLSYQNQDKIQELSKQILKLETKVGGLQNLNTSQELEIDKLKLTIRDWQEDQEINEEEDSEGDEPTSVQEKIGLTHKELEKLKYQQAKDLAKEAFGNKKYRQTINQMERAIKYASKVGVSDQEQAFNYFLVSHAYYKLLCQLDNTKKKVQTKYGKLAYNNIQGAIKAYPKLFEDNAKLEIAIWVMENLKKFDEAIKLVNDNFVDDYFHCLHLGSHHQRKGSHEEAYMWYCKGVETKPQLQINWWINITRSCVKLGNYDGALKYIEMALEQHPTDEYALRFKAGIEKCIVERSKKSVK